MLVLSLVAALSPAFAASAPDLTTSITAAAGQYVYTSGTWTVTATNSGTRDAGAVTVTVELPRTHTSPSVYVMGTVGATSCTLSSTHLTCTAASLRRGRSTSWTFGITLPQSSSALTFSATASTAGETNTSNNASTATASLLHLSPALPGGSTVLNRHCTGTGLTSFFECELYPSSIAEHEAVFNSDGSLTIPAAPTYTGSWSLSGSTLTFSYSDGSGTVVSNFTGQATDAIGCWEGVTTFPTSSYVAPYEVCVE